MLINISVLKTQYAKQGANLLQVDAINAQGPAGLMVSIISEADGRVLAHSDATWSYIANGCRYCLQGPGMYVCLYVFVCAYGIMCVYM
jgi:hypothetical protein